MNAVFTFKFSDLIAGLTPSNQWEWNGPCEAEMPADPVDPVETSERWNADLSVGPISESVRLHLIGHGDDEWHKQLSAAEADGTNDAMEVSVWPPGKGKKLFVYIGLRPQRYELFRSFVTLHFGRSDLSCRILSGIAGFATKSGLIYPTYNEFIEGRPYLMLDDDSSIEFTTKSLP
jgi:hypothetical protein